MWLKFNIRINIVTHNLQKFQQVPTVDGGLVPLHTPWFLEIHQYIQNSNTMLPCH